MSKLDDIERQLTRTDRLDGIPDYDVEWLIAEVRKLRTVLEPFALITKFEVDETYRIAGKILAEHIQRARDALKEED